MLATLRAYARSWQNDATWLARAAECRARRILPLPARQKGLARFEGCHVGQRAFFIGNGPSLRMEDLDRLKDEITFACNRVYLAFPATSWRPTYYGAEDILMFQHSWAEMATLPCRAKFFPDRALVEFPRMPGAVYFRLVYSWDGRQYPYFSKLAYRHVYGGNTVLYLMLQLAWFMGIRSFYLLGVDHAYQTPARHRVDPQTGIRMYTVANERSHFHPDYVPAGGEISDPNVDKHQRAFASAREAIEGWGGRIANATRGGYLDVIPRVDFDSLFPASSP